MLTTETIEATKMLREVRQLIAQWPATTRPAVIRERRRAPVKKRRYRARPADLHHINPMGDGYLVQFATNGKRVSRYFGYRKHGSATAALTAARAWRDRSLHHASR